MRIKFFCALSYFLCLFQMSGSDFSENDIDHSGQKSNSCLEQGKPINNVTLKSLKNWGFRRAISCLVQSDDDDIDYDIDISSSDENEECLDTTLTCKHPKPLTKKLKVKLDKAENEMLIYGYVKEFEIEKKKIIPNVIINLCIKYFRREIPCQYKMKRYNTILSDFDNDKCYKEVLHLCVRFKIEDLRGKLGSTILHRACKNGSISDVIFLLDGKANVNIQNYEGENPLHIACAKNDVTAVKLLLKNKANVNVQNYEEETPLHIACAKKYVEMAKLLLKNKADINVQNYEDETPLDIAKKIGNDKMITLLEKI